MAKNLSAKEYLQQLQELDINIQQDLERLSEMKEQATCSGSFDYSRERVQSSPSGDMLSKQVCGYVDFDERINREIDRFYDAKVKIIDEIRGLHDKYYIQILFKVYVQFKTLKQTSMEMSRSYQYIIQKHGEALAAFEKQYKNLTYLY